MATPGRNEPCSCGSGKKYKHCCLSKDEAAARAAHAAETKTEAEQPPAEAAPAETAPANAQATGRGQTNRPTRHATQQPWKRKDEKRGAPKFTVPRRSGSS
jgi:hypothetical protein